MLLVIDLPDQYKAIHCKPTNKISVCNKCFNTYHNSLENFNQFIDKFPKTFYSVAFEYLNHKNALRWLTQMTEHNESKFYAKNVCQFSSSLKIVYSTKLYHTQSRVFVSTKQDHFECAILFDI